MDDIDVIDEKKYKQVWEDCVRMWRWLKSKKLDKHNVYRYKIDYTYENKTTRQINHCFFCQYTNIDTNIDHEQHCSLCPGRLLWPEFYCENSDYSWNNNPLEFIEVLELMYAIACEQYEWKSIKTNGVSKRTK